MPGMKTQKKIRKRAAPEAAPAATPRASRRWWYVAGICALAFAGFQAYGSVLNGPFVFDDGALPFRMPNFKSNMLDWIGFNRPLLMLTYWVNYQISTTDTFWYHVYNVFFHICGSLLVFLIVRRMLSFAQARTGASDDTGKLLLSAFAAGVFLLHPVNTESVAYVASRSEALSVMLLLAALALFICRKSTAVTWPVAIGVLLLYGAAVSVKEHTVALIAVLLLTDYFWNPGFSFSGIRKNWRLYIPVALMAGAGAVFVFKVLARANTAGFNVKDFTWYQYFFTQCRVFFLYLRLFVFPVNQNADYAFPVSYTVTDHGAVIGLVVILALAALAIVYRRRFPLASYGFFIYLVLLAPTSSFIPIQDLVAERRLYLPMIGLLLILTDLLQRLPIERKVLAGAMAAVLILAGVLTYQRNTVWTSDVALWQDTVEKSPQKARAHFQLAYAYQFEANQCERAVQEYAAVDRIAGPAYERRYALLVDWAEALECAGKVDDALDKLRMAAVVEPGAHVFEEIGMMCAKHDRFPAALEAFQTAEKYDPNYPLLWANRGALYEKMRQYPQAIANYTRALQLDKSIQVAAAGLARSQRAVGVAR
jgi:tetratricopeptide (TPR) repeat protein